MAVAAVAALLAGARAEKIRFDEDVDYLSYNELVTHVWGPHALPGWDRGDGLSSIAGTGACGTPLCPRRRAHPIARAASATSSSHAPGAFVVVGVVPMFETGLIGTPASQQSIVCCGGVSPGRRARSRGRRARSRVEEAAGAEWGVCRPAATPTTTSTPTSTRGR